MKPVKFKGFDTIIAKNQPEYLALPAKRYPDGMIVSCWRLGFLERLRVFFTGRIFVSMLTFNRGISPLKLETSWKETEPC